MTDTKPEMLEVRCCCQPQRLLGWLPAPSHSAAAASFVLRGVGVFERITLRIAVIDHGNGQRYPAYKADGIPIETLRRIALFTENRDVRLPENIRTAGLKHAENAKYFDVRVEDMGRDDLIAVIGFLTAWQRSRGVLPFFVEAS